MADTFKPTEKERAAEPRNYWFHAFNGRPEFFWDDWEVTEDEYRRHARAEDIAYLDKILRAQVAE
jgi:hypothetical protein